MLICPRELICPRRHRKIVGEKKFAIDPEVPPLTRTAPKTAAPKTNAPKTTAPKTTDEINTVPMQEGDEFVDFKAFKAAMQDWAMTGCTNSTSAIKCQILHAM